MDSIEPYGMDQVMAAMERQAFLDSSPLAQKLKAAIRSNKTLRTALRSALQNSSRIIKDGIETLRKHPKTVTLLLATVSSTVNLLNGASVIRSASAEEKEASFLSAAGALAPFALLIAVATFLGLMNVDLGSVDLGALEDSISRALVHVEKLWLDLAVTIDEKIVKYHR